MRHEKETRYLIIVAGI